MDESAITCNEIIDAEAKSKDEETKVFPTNFNEKKQNLWNTKFLYFTNLFINCCCIFDSCQYLLLSDKILSKTKIFITTSQHK